MVHEFRWIDQTWKLSILIGIWTRGPNELLSLTGVLSAKHAIIALCLVTWQLSFPEKFFILRKTKSNNTFYQNILSYCDRFTVGIQYEEQVCHIRAVIDLFFEFGLVMRLFFAFQAKTTILVGDHDEYIVLQPY